MAWTARSELLVSLALVFARIGRIEGAAAVQDGQCGQAAAGTSACTTSAALGNVVHWLPDSDFPAGEEDDEGDALNIEVSLLQRMPVAHDPSPATQAGNATFEQPDERLTLLQSRREGLLRELRDLQCELGGNSSSRTASIDGRASIYVVDSSLEEDDEDDIGSFVSEDGEIMLGTSGDDFESHDYEDDVAVQEPWANDNSVGLNDLQTQVEKPADLVKPSGGSDVGAFDTQGPKPGHPWYREAVDREPDFEALKHDRSGVLRHVSKEDKELLRRLPAWPQHRKGATCKSALRSVKLEVGDARECQLRAQAAKFMFLQYSADVHGENCWLFHTCNLVTGGDSSKWDVYTDQQAYLFQAEGKTCAKKTVPNFDGANPVKHYFETDVKSIGECQEYARNKGHHFFTVKPMKSSTCSRYKECQQTTENAKNSVVYKIAGAPLKASSDQTKVFIPFQKVAGDATCKGEPDSVIHESDPGWCWRAPIKCYWRRSTPCQVEWSYYTVSSPMEYFSCTTFPECDSTQREKAGGMLLFSKALAPWPKASGCGGLAADTEPTAAGTDAVQECQSKASRRGHRFYQVGLSSGSCATARECGSRKCMDCAIFELPGDPKTNVTCSIERKTKAKLQDVIFSNMKLPTQEGSELPNRISWRPLATALRSVFHDAQDWNRLMAENKDPKVWQRVKVGEVGEHGGVDGCLYEPLGFGIKNKNYKVSGKYETSDDVGSQFLNMNLQRKARNMDPLRIDRHSPHYAEETCDYLCCDRNSPLDASEKSALCGAKPCDLSQEVNYRDKCMVDVTVLGVLMIIQHVGGPRIDMMWGRRQGDCTRVFKKVDVPESLDVQRIGLDASPFNAFGDMSVYVDDFKKLGFSPKEMVALMGAHSFGKMHKYAGALTIRNTARGFCSDPFKASPVVAGDQLNSKCKPSDSRACWTTRKAKDCQGGGCMELTPTGDSGWAMGGFWDTTPDKLDNEYFKMLSKEDTRQTQNCCGTYDGNCHKNGFPMQNMKGQSIDGCKTDYCMRDSTSMISTKMHIKHRRIFRLGADWALLENDEARAEAGLRAQQTEEVREAHRHTHRQSCHLEVERFAKDNDAFRRQFGLAFAKVINKGYPTEGPRALKECVG